MFGWIKKNKPNYKRLYELERQNADALRVEFDELIALCKKLGEEKSRLHEEYCKWVKEASMWLGRSNELKRVVLDLQTLNQEAFGELDKLVSNRRMLCETAGESLDELAYLTNFIAISIKKNNDLVNKAFTGA